MKGQNKAYELAAKRVKELKGFYRHIKIFVLVNGLLYLIKSGILQSLMPEWFPIEGYYFEWINGNLIIWGVILVIHTLIIFRHRLAFLKKWEQRQIEKLIEKDKKEPDKYL